MHQLQPRQPEQHQREAHRLRDCVRAVGPEIFQRERADSATFKRPVDLVRNAIEYIERVDAGPLSEGSVEGAGNPSPSIRLAAGAASCFLS
jgi:hypothetical protein